jgi:hypothetical protein
VQVWVCLAEPNIPAACGGAGANSSTSLGGGDGGVSGDLACYVFNERLLRFFFWGRNSDLRLVP